MTSLLSRFVRRNAKAPAPPVPVTVYSRRECCCCHKAIEVLDEFRRRHHLAVEVIDVDADPALAEAHGLAVPVVAIDGKVRFRGVVNPVLLERLLVSRRKNGGDVQ